MRGCPRSGPSNRQSARPRQLHPHHCACAPPPAQLQKTQPSEGAGPRRRTSSGRTALPPRRRHGRAGARARVRVLQPAGAGRVAGAAGGGAGGELPGGAPRPLHARPVGRQPGVASGPRAARRRRRLRPGIPGALDAGLLRRAPGALRPRREHVRPLPGPAAAPPARRPGARHRPAAARGGGRRGLRGEAAAGLPWRSGARVRPTAAGRRARRTHVLAVPGAPGAAGAAHRGPRVRLPEAAPRARDADAAGAQRRALRHLRGHGRLQGRGAAAHPGGPGAPAGRAGAAPGRLAALVSGRGCGAHAQPPAGEALGAVAAAEGGDSGPQESTATGSPGPGGPQNHGDLKATGPRDHWAPMPCISRARGVPWFKALRH